MLKFAGKANSSLNRTIGSQLFKFKCCECGRDFASKFVLQRHSKQGNCQSVPYFRCSLCGRSINHKHDFKRHFSLCHKDVKSSRFEEYMIDVEPTITCSVCSCRCKDLASLLKHIKQKHGVKSSLKSTLF